MVFYNQTGDECGGLIYGNQEAVFMFDQIQQDQIMVISYDEQGEVVYRLPPDGTNQD